MTSGRDEAKKRRGRGKAEQGPSDDDLGWLAELRSAGRGGEDDLGPFGGTPAPGDVLDQVNPRRTVPPQSRNEVTAPPAEPTQAWRAPRDGARESTSGSRPATPPPAAPEPPQAWRGRDGARESTSGSRPAAPEQAQGWRGPRDGARESTSGSRPATPPPPGAEATQAWRAPRDADDGH